MIYIFFDPVVKNAHPSYSTKHYIYIFFTKIFVEWLEAFLLNLEYKTDSHVFCIKFSSSINEIAKNYNKID